MKKRTGIILLVVICLLFTACKSIDKNVEENEVGEKKEETVVSEDEETESTEPEEIKPEEAEPEEPESTEPESTEPEETASVENTALLASYKDLMLELYNNHVLLGFGEISENTMGSGISPENKFALVDVDADGDDELIVYYLTTAVAWHIGAIYDYNDETGESYLKFKGYPLLSFYENGALEEGWSHNQGYAGDFWPYTLHEYDKENDRYNTVNYVDAYDRSLYEANQDAPVDSPFPYDVDIDGNGFVYYIYSYENSLDDYQEIQAVDDDAYQTWLQEYTEGSKKIEITFYSITEENIDRILAE